MGIGGEIWSEGGKEAITRDGDVGRTTQKKEVTRESAMAEATLVHMLNMMELMMFELDQQKENAPRIIQTSRAAISSSAWVGRALSALQRRALSLIAAT